MSRESRLVMFCWWFAVFVLFLSLGECDSSNEIKPEPARVTGYDH